MSNHSDSIAQNAQYWLNKERSSQEIGREFNTEITNEAWDLGPTVIYLMTRWEDVHPEVQDLIIWELKHGPHSRFMKTYGSKMDANQQTIANVFFHLHAKELLLS